MTISTFFAENPQVAVACSGGVDSALLVAFCGEYAQKVTAYFVQTEFQPAFELADAQAVCDQVGVPLRVLRLSALSNQAVAGNPKNRCYHCKHMIFDAIIQAAQADGYAVILDGSNLDDDPADRPGMAALAEKGVISPLRLWGFTKNHVRFEAKNRGLAVWNKPAYACLATRVPENREITVEILKNVEFAEEFLEKFGISDHRVRVTDGGCNIQVPQRQMGTILEHKDEIIDGLSPIFKQITLDLGGRER